MSQTYVFTYDDSWEGLLSVVFSAFERKVEPSEIRQEDAFEKDLFSEVIPVVTQTSHAGRVWEALVKKTSLKNARLVYVAFLAHDPQKEMLLWRYLKKVFTSEHKDYYQNMLDEDVYAVVQMARKVKKEAHLFLGLVRFEQTADDMLFAPVEPDHDILWLMARHFQSRFAEQKWVIYDTRRGYGIFYDRQQVSEVHLENAALNPGSKRLDPAIRDEREDHYRKLWQQYYRSVNNPERSRKNQMTRLMPKRYWKYLPEKDCNSG